MGNDRRLMTHVNAHRAVASGLLIGSSFVFKKRGLIRSQAGGAAGEGVAYLKSVRVFYRFHSRTTALMPRFVRASHYGGRA